MSGDQHMRFQRLGRARHLRITSAADLAHVPDLDEAHWVASGAPIDTLNGDATFLGLVDTDRNGRIMCFEVIEAIRWLLATLRDPAGVTRGSTTLPLSAIDPDSPDGAVVHRAASKMLTRTGADAAESIDLDEVRRVKAAAEARPVSDAGVLLPEAAEDPEVRQFLADIVATVGGAPHPSGRSGVGAGQLDTFVAEARAHLDWRAAADAAVMPLGDDTPTAYGVYAALRGKIDAYFELCAAADFDPRLADKIARREAEFRALDVTDPAAVATFMTAGPLAAPRPDGMLPLEEGLNPCHASAVARLRDRVLHPVLGNSPTALSAQQWQTIRRFFAAHEAWLAAKAGTEVEPLGLDKLRRYLDARFGAAVQSLIAESSHTALVLDHIRLTEKLILYQAHLIALANNFVSFPHLYDPASRAMFERGTLVMDGRRFTFATRVTDRARHVAVAKAGEMFVLYVEVVPRDGQPKYEVAIPVTAGGKGNLFVGKRGLFQDVRGGESDAQVVQIVENPISLREAIASPFKRIGKLLSGKIEAMTTSAETELDQTTKGVLDRVEQGARPPEPAKAPAASRGLMAGGLLMGGGVALAALGSAAAYIGKTLSNPDNYVTILAVMGAALLAVIVPTSIIAIGRLRRRDLSEILEGSGWAINARMRLTRSQSRTFTRRPRYPLMSLGESRWWMWALPLAIALIAGGAIVWHLW